MRLPSKMPKDAWKGQSEDNIWGRKGFDGGIAVRTASRGAHIVKVAV